jgi:hypothetical protein
VNGLTEKMYLVVEGGKVIAAFHSLADLKIEHKLSSNGEIYCYIVFVPWGKSTNDITFTINKISD